MLFWVLAAALTISCVAAALLPLVKKAGDTPDRSRFDIEVYKDQLEEIERDTVSGAISAADAETARIEVSRRILKLSGPQSTALQPTATSGLRRAAAIGIAALVPLLSWGLYSALGTPELPDQPVSARSLAAPGDNSMASLLAKAEEHLAKNPSDGRGWEVLAPIYLRMGRYEDAAAAWALSIELNGDNAMRQSGLGEALTGAAGGRVTQEAMQVFEHALSLDPNEPRARLFMAISLAQQGKADEARAALESQLAMTPQDAPWRPVLENALASLTKSAPAKGKGENGPAQADIDNAAQLSEADRMAMIETMVEGLAEKLKANPDDIEGWQRLMRSYMVMGRKDDAAAAFDTAQRVLKSDAARLSSIRAFARELEIGTQ